MTAIAASPAKQSLAEQLARVDASLSTRKSKPGNGDGDPKQRGSVARSASLRTIIAESLSRQTSSNDLTTEPFMPHQDLQQSSVGAFSTATTRSNYMKRKQKISLPPVHQRYGGDLVSSWHNGPFTLSDSKIAWLSRQHRPPLHAGHKSESPLVTGSQYEQYSDAQARKLGMHNMLMLMGMSKEGVVSKVNRIQRTNILNKPKRKRNLKQIGRSASKDLDILQEQEVKTRNLDLYDAAVAVTTVPARREVQSGVVDARDMLQCTQTDEGMCSFRRGTLLPRVVQERCATPVGILLDASDAVPRLEEIQRCLEWPPRARLALKLLGQSIEGRHREYLLMHLELIADTTYFGAVLANMISLIEQHKFPFRPAHSNLVPETMFRVLKTTNIYRPPEPDEMNHTWLTRMYGLLGAAQARMWDSLLKFVQETGANIDITEYLVSLSDRRQSHGSY